MPDQLNIYAQKQWFRAGRGPRYQQLHKHISAVISSGELAPQDHLPAERELAEIAEISRVTVRKAIDKLVADGLIERRQGAGSIVRSSVPRLKQSLSNLVSFTENMSARGVASTSEILMSGLFAPNPDEMIALGLSGSGNVARLRRLRSADNVPMALEISSLPPDILPNPELVQKSLYALLRQAGQAPTRAIQRVSALNVTGEDAKLLQLPEGTAVLKIDRTGYLSSKRPIEFTTGLYRSDIYDFISELGVE